MAGCPPRSLYKQQGLVLAEVKSPANREALRHVEAIRVTNLAGETHSEAWEPLTPPDRSTTDQAALAALAALRLRAKKDNLPCRVTSGLYIGGAGAAKNLKALRKRGITHIVNAAPSIPSYFRDSPEGGITYLAVELYDNSDADLLVHLDATTAFIAGARQAGGGVLVHCYAGQSRSAALIMAYLIASRGMGVMDAWAAVRRARPSAQPNSGFLRQLSTYAKRHIQAGCSPGSSPSDSEPELLTQ